MIKYNSVEEFLNDSPNNETIKDSITRTWLYVHEHKSPMCSISGGGDSDCVIDLVSKCDTNNKVKYVFFDTGLEFKATKNQLDYLEDKYDVKILRFGAKKPIPLTCYTDGQPFISKFVSDMIHRLQSHNFNWEYTSFEESYSKYPKCKGALRWWYGLNDLNQFNITRNKLLLEYMINNPPNFKISSNCCYGAKKNPAHDAYKKLNADLNIIGVRKAEGGIRASAYKTCYFKKSNNQTIFAPLLWWTDKDKKEYESYYNITHSKCYTEYGLKRTGCAGCPYGRNVEQELDMLKQYEPLLYKGCLKTFEKSYEYTKNYYKFREKFENK